MFVYVWKLETPKLMISYDLLSLEIFGVLEKNMGIFIQTNSIELTAQTKIRRSRAQRRGLHPAWSEELMMSGSLGSKVLPCCMPIKPWLWLSAMC